MQFKMGLKSISLLMVETNISKRRWNLLREQSKLIGRFEPEETTKYYNIRKSKKLCVAYTLLKTAENLKIKYINKSFSLCTVT